MLIGRIDGTVGDGKRISFPKEYRTELGDKLVITKGENRYLVAVSQNSYKTLLEGIEGKPFINKSAREAQRFILGNATQVALDPVGRFVFPEFLQEYAGIKKDVIFAGMEGFVEIWVNEQWEKHQSVLAEEIPSIVEKNIERQEGEK